MTGGLRIDHGRALVRERKAVCMNLGAASMGVRTKKTSTLDRRLQEIQKERSSVRGHIKSVTKTIETRRSTPAPDPTARGTRAPVPMAYGSHPADPTSPNDGVLSESSHRRQTPYDRRFFNFFARGSFEGSLPLRQEKRVQRNKAIFMLAVVAVVAFVVFKLVL